MLLVEEAEHGYTVRLSDVLSRAKWLCKPVLWTYARDLCLSTDGGIEPAPPASVYRPIEY